MSNEMTDYMRYIHLSRYARWQEETGRRETWEETVNRYTSFFHKRMGTMKKHLELFEELNTSITSQEVCPSMRCLMTAGVALDRDNVAGFNCSYTAVDHPRVFDEIMYILMCGTGVGFSVERQYINQLPEVAHEFHETATTIIVSDSKIGWASAYRELISMLYAGKIPQWDLSRIRKAGERLKTFGGRASGPDPLDDLFRFTIGVFTHAQGRKLNSLECHDVVCKVADIVVVGGVRRSALISLSNLTDARMRDAKNGAWYDENPQRALANNSVCYTEKPDMNIFMKEGVSLYESKCGERGLFSREASQRNTPERRDSDFDFGTNPCSEIVLRNKQFCNLTEVVVRSDDTFDSLKRKVRLATILGTLQATLTNFRYLRPIWKRNTEEEALLGVSLTGIMDHPILSGSYGLYGERDFPSWFENEDRWVDLNVVLNDLKEIAIETNKEWAEKLAINPSSSITCVKPSGTVSQLVDSASGIHPRYSNFYIRTVRTDKKDPLYQMMSDMGIPVEDAIGKEDSTAIFSFPIKSPEGSVMRDDRTAIEQLELWKTYAVHWCEHKPSITVYYKEEEFLEVWAWVYDNFDIMSGVSFLPHTDHVYKQAPYQEIDEETYMRLVDEMPKVIDWRLLEDYENDDFTTGSQEYACASGGCEIL